MASTVFEKWLTTKEVAEHFSVPVHRVLRVIREGKLKATKVGWQWLVRRDHLPAEWPPAA